MTQINLLTWREQALKVKQTRFIVMAVSAVLLGIFFVIGFHLYYASALYNQIARNQFLQTQLGNEQVQLNALITKKKDLVKADSDLHFLMHLREQSYQAVQLLDAIARATPDTITVTKITRDGNNITINAKAISNADISLLIEKLGQMKIFNLPVLSDIATRESPAGNIIIFEVKVEQKG